ncbi:hypothetical protein HYX12_01905, partial [Candidatus Woesearchaeota archaeon]|nr:hypothetical protein [Candidatus Woesearchaeota archaeon]
KGRKNASSTRNKSKGSRGISYHVSPEGVDYHISSPLKELFHRDDFGFVVVALPEMMDVGNAVSFRERGGYLIPFYASREKFHEDAIPYLRTAGWNTQLSLSKKTGFAKDIDSEVFQPLVRDQRLYDYSGLLDLLQSRPVDHSVLDDRVRFDRFLFMVQVKRNLERYPILPFPVSSVDRFHFVEDEWGRVVFAYSNRLRKIAIDGLYVYQGTPVILDSSNSNESRVNARVVAVRTLTEKEPYFVRIKFGDQKLSILSSHHRELQFPYDKGFKEIADHAWDVLREK